ncbi:MAG: hypothetical protein QXT84_06055 [Candidatus Bathyarchaeia archaeon]
MTITQPLVWNTGNWNNALWGPTPSIETETPYVTQACVAYTPTFPNVPVPQTPRYIFTIQAGAVIEFKPGIYWERCTEQYIYGGGSPLGPGGLSTPSPPGGGQPVTTQPVTTNVTITLLGD